MAQATWNGVVVAESDDTVVVEGNHYFPRQGLREEYFRHYRKLVYLSQHEDADLLGRAREAARFLKLDFEHRRTGYGDLERVLVSLSRPDAPEESTSREPTRRCQS